MIPHRLDSHPRWTATPLDSTTGVF